MQVKAMDFNVRFKKTQLIIDIASDSTLQLAARKLPPVEFDGSSKNYP